MPLEEDWVKANDMCYKLIKFYHVTELFSGTKYPTANLFFPKVCDIRLAIEEWIQSGTEHIKMMAVKMKENFEKYWEAINGIMDVASVLDPRYKMK